MKSRSLGLRLVFLACLSIAIALTATGIVLSNQFHGYFEDRLYSELENHLNQLTVNISLDENDDIVIADLPDPRFALPFSGLYWQVLEVDGTDILSRSLWGERVTTPIISQPGQQIRGRTFTNQNTSLLTLTWEVLFGSEASPRTLLLTVATDETEIHDALNDFRKTLIQWLVLMFVFLILASWVQVRLGLSPLEAIREKIQNIRSGVDLRLEGDFPAEVKPLADEVNELLTLHDSSLETARTRASDLAHGLKTPLSIMLILADDVQGAGAGGIADDIRVQVDSMTHIVERELAKTRLRLPSGFRVRAKPIVQRMTEMIAKLPRETALDWQLDVPDNLMTPFDEHDLSELMGNMLDNARKWAKSSVRVTGGNMTSERSYLAVDDDGPGVPREMIDTILSRGGRLDENIQGSGLGLAICADMALEYGVDLKLEKSELGGLRVLFYW